MGASLGSTLNVYDLCYPAALYYFVNTPLKATSDGSFTSWPNTANAWENETWADWSDKVEATTRTIALKNNIQYGVASLKTTVKCASSTLKDNAKSIVGGNQEDNDIVVPTEGFTVTGILIGGQPASVDWDFLPGGSEQYSKTIYTCK